MGFPSLAMQEAGDDCSNVQYVTFAPAADFGS